MVTSQEQPPNESPLTFEVFPRSAGEMQDLMAFLAERNMGYRIPQPDKTDEFEFDTLYETSGQLFGTNTHGLSAANVLHALHQSCRGTATIARNGVVVLRRGNGIKPLLGMGTPVTSVGQFSHASLEKATVQKIRATSPPFEISTAWEPRSERTSNGGGGLSLSFSAARFTNTAVRNYVTTRSYNSHGLTGNMGKALSTLARATGYDDVPLENLDYKSELVSRGDLLKEMQDKVHPQNIGYAKDKLNKILLEQLFSGRRSEQNGVEQGEVILGGSEPFKLINTPKGYEVQYDKIVRESLAVVAFSYARETSTSRFWREVSGL